MQKAKFNQDSGVEWEDMVDIVNLTPHAIVLMNEGEQIIEVIAPSTMQVRMLTEQVLVDHIETPNGLLPLYSTAIAEPEFTIDGVPCDDPEYDDMVIYVVSGLVRGYLPRPDFYQPGRLVRDENGRVIGCVGLSK